MSSLPSISHHLFVAAVRQDGQPAEKPRPNQGRRKGTDEKLAPAETPLYNEGLDHAMADSSGSLVQ